MMRFHVWLLRWMPRRYLFLLSHRDLRKWFYSYSQRRFNLSYFPITVCFAFEDVFFNTDYCYETKVLFLPRNGDTFFVDWMQCRPIEAPLNKMGISEETFFVVHRVHFDDRSRKIFVELIKN